MTLLHALFRPYCNFLRQVLYARDDLHIWANQGCLYLNILNPLIVRVNSHKKLFTRHRPRTKLIERNRAERLFRKPERNGGCLAQMHILPYDLLPCRALVRRKWRTTRIEYDKRSVIECQHHFSLPVRTSGNTTREKKARLILVVCL